MPGRVEERIGEGDAPHTHLRHVVVDDQPIFLKKTEPPKPGKPDPKAPKPTKPSPPPSPRKEYITNWELSAARALQVVHYLQDTAKIDPSRLAALAFGQYRPVSRSNKALNRRIEIVLYPKKVVATAADPRTRPAPSR